MASICRGGRSASHHLSVILSLILVGTAHAQSPPNELGRFLTQTFAPGEYNADPYVWYAAQGNGGLMYFANLDGVLEYDGRSWRTIWAGGTVVRSLAADSAGRIYVGKRGDFGVLEPDSVGRLQYRSLTDHVPERDRGFGDVWQMFSTSRGVYLSTSTHVFRWSESEGIRIWRGDFHKAFVVRGEVYVRDFEQGLVRLNESGTTPVPDGRRFVEDAVTAMLPYDESRILLSTYHGELFLYDGAAFVPFVTEADAFLRTHLPYYYAFAVLPGGRFALGTRDGGVVVIDREGRVLSVADRSSGLRTNKIYYILPDHEGGLWLTHEDGISRWEGQSPTSYFDETTGLTGNVEAIHRHDGTLYAATSSGIFELTAPAEPGRTSRFKQVEGIQPQCWDLASLEGRLLAGCTTGVYEVVGMRLVEVARSESAVFSLLASEQRPSRVYVGLKDGLGRMRLEGRTWTAISRVEGVRIEVRSMTENADGTLWMGGANALLHIDPDRAEGAVIKRFSADHGLPTGYVDVYRAAGRTLVVAQDGVRQVTSNLRLQQGSFLDDAVPGVHIEEIREDDRGQIWTRTSDGIGAVRRVSDDEWVWEPALSPAGWPVDVIYPDPEGAVWLGGVDGIARFDVAHERIEPSFDAFVRRIATIRSDSLVFGGAGVPDGRPINIRYDDNALRFTAGAATFNRPAGSAVVPQFQFRLEGFDEGWSGWTGEIHKDYTNLPEGEYFFRVRARSAGGAVSPAAAVAFTVLPPWYRTWWAYAIYAVFGLAILYTGGRWNVARLERRNRMLESLVAERSAALARKTGELENANARLLEHERELKDRNVELETQANRLKELDAIKSRFFANISHEFRTPLTLILGPLEDALENRDAPKQDLLPHVEPMHRNASRLLGLINQLLDLSRLESGGMTLRARRADLTGFLRRTASVFESRAARKGVALEVDVPDEALHAYFDAEKLERVLINLLSNAFKFTPNGGRIGLRFSLRDGDSEQAAIMVEDSGPGIPHDELDRIFDRFYTVERSASYEQEGSGIGLALARELMELHGGAIDVESRLGAGTVFTVTLPLGRSHLDPGDIVVGDSLDEASADAPYTPVALAASAASALSMVSPDSTSAGQASSSGLGDGADSSSTSDSERDVDVSGAEGDAVLPKRATILVAEDNEDLRAYLRAHLDGDYQVEEAVNGLEALEMAKAIVPHLIISDVMMPKMDGYALCEAVKADEDLCHIPFVLLTARASDADKVEGLALGADDYLFKPFNKDELLVRVENLIEIRRILRRRFGKEVVAVEASEIEIVPADAALLDQVTTAVEAHVDDANFGVDWLADEVGMSARQLQRRIKELTGLTPSGFIRSIRLQRAAQLLEAGAGNVSEVADAVGFNDAKHFSKLFRQVFGTAPSQYEGEAD